MIILIRIEMRMNTIHFGEFITTRKYVVFVTCMMYFGCVPAKRFVFVVYNQQMSFIGQFVAYTVGGTVLVMAMRKIGCFLCCDIQIVQICYA